MNHESLSRPARQLGIHRWLRWGVLLLALGLLVATPLIAQKYQTVTVKRGDTLWALARQYLGDPLRWPEFNAVNYYRSGNPHLIYPGEVFNIPGTEIVEKPEPEEIELPVSLIEEMLKDMQGRLGSISSELETIRGRLDSLEKRAEGFELSLDEAARAVPPPPVINLSALEERMDALERSVTDLVRAEVQDVRESQNATAADIRMLKGELDALAKSVSQQLEMQQRALEELQRKITVAETEPEELASKRRTMGLISVLAAGIAFVVVNATR